MIKWYTSKTELDHHLLNFCKSAVADNRDAAVNMDPVDYENKPHTLLYKLYVEKVFDSGGYGLYIENDQVLGGSGYYATSWHPDLFVYAVRSYTPPNMFKKYSMSDIMYEQIELIKKLGGNSCMITWNQYNLPLMKKFLHVNVPENHRNSFIENGLWYRKPGIRLNPHLELPFPVTFNYTKQWVTYILLDDTFGSEFLEIASTYKCDT